MELLPVRFSFAGMEEGQVPALFPDASPTLDFQKLYQEVYAQILKDFAPIRPSEGTPEVLSSEWIESQTLYLVRSVLTDHPGHFSNIIYRVDLPERASRQALSASDADQKVRELAGMIVKREAQKVWFRHKYKS